MATITHRVEIKQEHIDAAVLQAKLGLPKGQVVLYSDTSLKGLQIRVQGKRASWFLKYFDWTKAIGCIHPTDERHLPSVRNARKLAGACKEVLDDDPRMLKPFLKKYYASGEGNIKSAKADMRPVSKSWTLGEALEFVIRERSKPDAAEPIGTGSCSDWRRALRRAAAKEIVDMPVSDLTKGHCDTIKRKISETEGASCARKFIAMISATLNYCLDHAPGETGLDHRNMWWTMLKAGAKSKPRTRKPSVDEVVRTLLLAEKYLHAPLPGRTDQKRGVRENVYSALWWYCLTVQRSTAGVRLRMVDFFPDPKRPNSGWYLAFWEEGEMKAGVAFTLPIPPRAAKLMLGLIEKAKRADRSQWAFPSERGSQQNDIAVNRSSAAAVIERLAARDTPTRNNPALAAGSVDLLAENGITYWSPHDLRRTIVDVMEDAGIPGGASAVLAHEVKLSADLIFDLSKADQEKYLAMRVARVTKLAYGAGQFMSLKSHAMQIWTDAILDRYDELSGHTAARARKKKEKALRYLLVLDPGFAPYYKADAEAKFDDLISRYKADIASAIASRKQLEGKAGQSSQLAELDREIVSCEISIQQFMGEQEQFILRIAAAERQRLIQDHPNFDFARELPDYDAVWKRFVLGAASHDDLLQAARNSLAILSDTLGLAEPA